MAYQIETTCICGDPETSKNHSFGAVSVPIYQTATFAHPGIGESTGHNYTRESNPTRDELEKTVSALEGAVDTVACTSGMAVPSFFLGMILTYVFGLILHMFQPGKFIEPSENFGKSAQYLLFPALAVALPKIAMVVKFLRSSILTEMNREYVRTAYSRGNTETAVLYGHVLKNAMIPVVTFDGNRGDPCRQHRGGAGVQRAGNRKTSDQLDLQPRLSGCAGDRAVYHIGGRTYQFCG